MKKILVVEDDSVLRENIKIILQEEYSVVVAEDGSKAITKLEQEQGFDLILSDIMMPVTDGYELYDYLKGSDNLSDIPFIFLTARANNSAIREGMNLGVDDYITKPFTIDDLLNGIKTRLTKKEREIKKFDKLKNDISLYIPHELRTPLVSIIGNTDMISSYFDELSKSEILEMSDSINRSGKRLKRSIEKFLKYAELTIQKINGFTEFKSTDTFYSNKHNCKSVLMSCYDCTKRLNDISFNFSNAEIEIVQEDFEVIMMELVANASKFSDKNTPIIVTGNIVNDKYIVTITDKGRGISVENIKKIDSFVQFDRDFYQQEGNGIGLALVKLICEKYNVEFSIESEVDKFTKVTLLFPINLNYV